MSLETASNAVRGFSNWLRSSPPTDTEEGREFNDQLLYALEIYAGELQRQIDGTAPAPDWLNVIAVTSALVTLLQDELYEVNPGPRVYRPEVEPQSIDQMVARLLSDALQVFAQCERTAALEPITGLVHRIRHMKATA